MSLKSKNTRNEEIYDTSRDPQKLLKGNDLKNATHQLAEAIQTKISNSQNGIGTFFDHGLLGLIKELQQLDAALPWEEGVKRLGGLKGAQLRIVIRRLQIFLNQRNQGHLVEFQQRFRRTRWGLRSDCDIGILELTMSQGVAECMHWKGLPLFKTAFDFSLYSMMLWNLKPKTIIELGSGNGSSSIWMADLLKTFEINSKIYSVDLKKPDLDYENVTFIQGDCRAIEDLFSDSFLRSRPHPWLLIEDAHVNTNGVLECFHPYFTQGDYIVIEDSKNKRKDIANFLVQYPTCYKVDTHYTDFFGRNATCAHDSIFVRMQR
jgi:cephalosporin hydroxylase